MKKAKRKWLRIISIGMVTVLLLTTALVVYVGYSFYFSPLPQTSGVSRVEGLNNSVTVYRDSWAIPQIYATNNPDLFFTMGYVHAQDRWWQMELNRYLAMGRLHEILLNDRAAVLDADHLMRTLDFENQAKAQWQTVSTETRQVLNAYAAGINAYIQSREVRALASEYGLVGLAGQFDSLLIYLGREVDIEPWEPYQSLLLWQLFEFSQSNDLWSPLEAAIAASAQADGDVRVLSLVSTLAFESELSTTELTSLYARRLPYTTRQFMQQLGFSTQQSGLSWVLAGERTVSGKGLLSSVMYAPPEIPGVWYEVGLHCVNIQPDCTYDAVGFSLVGVPIILSGHNGSITWSLNPTGYAAHDLSLVMLNPDNPKQYRHDGEWLEFETQTIIPPDLATSTTAATAPAPMLYDSVLGTLVTEPAGRYALSVRPHAAVTRDDPLGAMLAVMQATCWPTFQEALQRWQQPTATLLYADVNGNIGYQMSGAVLHESTNTPVLDHRGRESTPATTSQPPGSLYNPASGAIVLVNGQFVPEGVSGQLIQNRVLLLLDQQTTHAADSIAQIQGDSTSILAPELLPYLASLTFEDTFVADTRDWLLRWDYNNDRNSAQATVFNLWMLIVLEFLHVSDVLGADDAQRLSLAWKLPALMPAAEHPLWDNPRTLLQETRDTNLTVSFEMVVNGLVARFGEDYEQWTWARFHEVNFTSKVIGERDLMDLNLVVSSGPFPINRGAHSVSGALDAVNRTLYWFESPEDDSSSADIPSESSTPALRDLQVVSVPAYRLIIDMGALDDSRAMHNTGQSGHPASDHYVDMIAPWRTLDYHDLRWGLSAVRESATQELELRPTQIEG